MSFSRVVQASLGKRLINPIVRWSLGSGPTLPTLKSSVAVVEHRGRKSGKPYETPVGFVPNGSGSILVVAERGARSDWVRNGMSAGHVWVRSEGRRWKARPALRLDLDTQDTLKEIRSGVIALSNRLLQDGPQVVELTEV